MKTPHPDIPVKAIVGSLRADAEMRLGKSAELDAWIRQTEKGLKKVVEGKK